jgi:hypothetical protein
MSSADLQSGVNRLPVSDCFDGSHFFAWGLGTAQDDFASLWSSYCYLTSLGWLGLAVLWQS